MILLLTIALLIVHVLPTPETWGQYYYAMHAFPDASSRSQYWRNSPPRSMSSRSTRNVAQLSSEPCPAMTAFPKQQLYSAATVELA
jgi:hypothetical protein